MFDVPQYRCAHEVEIVGVPQLPKRVVLKPTLLSELLEDRTAEKTMGRLRTSARPVIDTDRVEMRTAKGISV